MEEERNAEKRRISGEEKSRISGEEKSRISEEEKRRISEEEKRRKSGEEKGCISGEDKRKISGEEKSYLCIDLKSFYASVECVERGLDPFRANLVVADASRTDKTICLAVSPALKSFGIGGRPRLFEVNQKVAEINNARRRRLWGGRFKDKAIDAVFIRECPAYELDFIIAPPQMRLYMQYSARIFEIYLKYVAFEDIFPYSVDEVFVDITPYLTYSHMTPREFAMQMIKDVYQTTGITATAGIGTNMYLAKVAMDIVAKKMPADSDGVRIAELDEAAFRRELWAHRPLTDFWNIGSGISRRLERCGMWTMGDIARMSLKNESLLYSMFGVNAELIIDHAWGYESCTMADVKNYRPKSTSISSGQVLTAPTSADTAKIILKEMADSLSLDLISRGMVTDHICINVGYDIENLSDEVRRSEYEGEVVYDHYGRAIPKGAHASKTLERFTASTRTIVECAEALFDSAVDKNLLIRRLNIAAARLLPKDDAATEKPAEQLQLFVDYSALEIEREKKEKKEKREAVLMETVVALKKKYGKNSILKGMNYLDGATGRERNEQVGGHKG